MPIPNTAFAVRFVYGATTLDFDEPALALVVTARPVAAGNRVYSGKTEWLFGRLDHMLTLSWMKLSTAKITDCYAWYTNHYARGGQTAITLDRNSTAGGQAEFDSFNMFFTKAEPPDLVIPPFPGQRTIIERAFYTFGPVVFRQGV